MNELKSIEDRAEEQRLLKLIEGELSTFVEAKSGKRPIVVGALRYCFSFSGRFNRTQFWVGYGFAFLMMLTPILGLSAFDMNNNIVTAVGDVWYFLWLVSILAVITKRLHDLNHSALLLWAFLAVPIMGGLLAGLFPGSFDAREGKIAFDIILMVGMIALGFKPGVPGKNRFGPDPLLTK